MGVLTCQRGNCDNIMCGRHSDTHGYICDECFSELCATNPLSIKQFMSSDKIDPRETPGVDYDEIFPSR